MTLSSDFKGLILVGPSSGSAGSRQPIRVCAPAAHSGIGDALRRAFTPATGGGDEIKLMRMLDQV